MQHLKILVYFIILMAGVVATVRMVMVSRSADRTELRSLPLLLILFNLIVLINLTSVYTCANLLVNCLLYHSSFYPVILGSAGRTAFLAMLFTFISIGMDFRAGSVPDVYRRRLLISGISIPAGYALLTALARSFPHLRPLVWMDLSVFFLALFLLLFQLTRLVRYGLILSDLKKRRMLISLGTFYLAAFMLFTISSTMPGNDPFPLNAVTLLLCNLFPLVWLNRYFPASAVSDPVPVDLQAPMDEICIRHNISNREREVAELILQGKSNQEIQDQLFISVSTVKNHIYRLFRKLGVNSRGQLVNIVLQTRNGRTGS
ncbi:response regulator transcription factor [Gemmatimonadota bacterium]